ncbi:hypothetical protein ABZ916_24265 [Streptomyces sp. NPDC046853]|uniref:hypothetical protein n=1 Tax=Streptomyces sp. NPDC046853 TaxID=3154920 RepID=UPI0033CE793D
MVDLSEAEFFSAEVLNELLRPARKGGHLPRLAGPLSPVARRRLEVTGTLKFFEVFPTLANAVIRLPDTAFADATEASGGIQHRSSTATEAASPRLR